ncbi:hypothetical protein CVT25_014183 [Psilocybe cyanescens]|uniref:Uncharacterized protein n=1 Tax=Psilocybe cyanescens TaxID=93625 RepID=A0A409X904_PSICY|nr:hypothetical protein CVT25_014183 [Psilocybe cyanescens]
MNASVDNLRDVRRDPSKKRPFANADLATMYTTVVTLIRYLKKERSKMLTALHPARIYFKTNDSKDRSPSARGAAVVSILISPKKM